MQFPAMPVVVETPAHPVAVAPVARDAVGAWKELASGQGVKMGFFDERNNMNGFVLTGEFANERSEMTKLLTAWSRGGGEFAAPNPLLRRKAAKHWSRLPSLKSEQWC